ncbi:hypothetical protein JW992_13075 [candidate division KSB1 bacterium]|nr:hypothetical protein [candidate division KSB1 bacterium]
MDVLHYDIVLDLDFSRQQIDGQVEILLLPPADTNISLGFDLIDMRVDSVRMEDRRVPFYRTATRVEIDYPANLSDTLRVQIYYGGKPQNSGFGGFFWRGEYAFTIGEAINRADPSALKYWVPSNDRPDDKATCTFELRVPTGLTAIANGSLVAVAEEASQSIFSYRESHPIATYLIAIAVGPYEVLCDEVLSINGELLPLSYYLFPADVEKARVDWLPVVPKMMLWLETQFGAYPFSGYAMVQVPSFGGAMEHQQISFFSSSLLTGDGRFESIVLHELAHQWWGNWVTLGDWREIWLNEGFASYCEILYVEATKGVKARNTTLENFSSLYFDEISRRGHFPLYDPLYAWGGTVYKKGAWVLHMLRGRMGDESFFAAWNGYGRRHAYGTGSIDGFKAIAKEISGLDLDSFFREWIYGTGYPQLYFSWNHQADPVSCFQLELICEQVQQQTLFSQPVPIAWCTATDTLYDEFLLQGKRTVHRQNWRYRPRALVIDAENWLLKKAAIVSAPLPDGVATDDLYLAQNYPNPFGARTTAEETVVGFQVSVLKTPVEVTLRVYDLSGRLVRVLLHQPLSAGYYQVNWDGRDAAGLLLPAGNYFCELSAAGRCRVRKLLFFP